MKNSILLALGLILLTFPILAQETRRQSVSAETLAGVESYQIKDFPKALETLTKIVQTDPKNYVAWLYLTAAAIAANDMKAAKSARKNLNKLKGVKFPAEDELGYQGVKSLSKPYASYTDKARQNQISGTVKLLVEFSSNEEIKVVAAISSLPFGLTENSIAAARQIKFEPARKDGKPVTTLSVVEYNFHIY